MTKPATKSVKSVAKKPVAKKVSAVNRTPTKTVSVKKPAAKKVVSTTALALPLTKDELAAKQKKSAARSNQSNAACANPNGRRITFLRGKHDSIVGCIAYVTTAGKVSYQVSVLNPCDQFKRDLARQIAIGRLVEKPITLTVPRDANMVVVMGAIMESISSSDSNPTRAKKAADLWLNSSNMLSNINDESECC